MSRFFWYANVLFRLTCNSPSYASAIVSSIAQTSGIISQYDDNGYVHAYVIPIVVNGMGYKPSWD